MFDGFSGSSGRWKYTEVSPPAGCGDSPTDLPDLSTDEISWSAVDPPSPETDESITSWKITETAKPNVKLNFDCLTNRQGMVFPEVRRGGIGGWTATISGVCSPSGNFEAGTPLVCDFIFHKLSNVGRLNAGCLVVSLDEMTAVDASTATFTIQVLGAFPLPDISCPEG